MSCCEFRPRGERGTVLRVWFFFSFVVLSLLGLVEQNKGRTEGSNGRISVSFFSPLLVLKSPVAERQHRVLWGSVVDSLSAVRLSSAQRGLCSCVIFACGLDFVLKAADQETTVGVSDVGVILWRLRGAAASSRSCLAFL